MIKLKKYLILNNTHFFTLVLLGFAVRILISWFSIGSNDATTFLKFADYISNEGLLGAYAHFKLTDNGGVITGFNHPPLIGLWLGIAKSLADFSGWSFYFSFRLLPILADAGTCYLLLKIFTRSDGEIKGWSVAASYSWCMAAILISGYHANTDSVYAFFCLLAAYFIQEKKAFFLAGLALACAINVKLIPVILIVPLFLLCHNRRDFLKVFSGLAIGALPYLFCLVAIGSDFFHNVLGYKGIPSFWGVTFLFSAFNLFNPSVKYFFEVYYCSLVPYITLIASALLGLQLKRMEVFNAYEILVMCMVVLFLLTPALGVQYLAGIIPLLFATNLKEGENFGYISGFFVLVCYVVRWTGTIPFYSDFYFPIPEHAAVIGIVVYFIILKFFIKTLRKKEPK
jgi:hypothetical protein